jgi:hypothetical protein
MPISTISVRPSRLRRWWIAAAAVSVLAGAGVGHAAEAQADVDPVAVEYAKDNAAAVCSTLDDFPSVAGVAGIAQAIVEQGYLSYYQAGQAIAISVMAVCPEHQPVLDRFIARYSGAQPVMRLMSTAPSIGHSLGLGLR